MLLTDLAPELETVLDSGKEVLYLTFTCPTCEYDAKKSRYGNCLISIPVAMQHDPGTAWGIDSKDLNTLTVTPSIWHHCKSDPHFFIRGGAIEMA